MAKYRVSWPVEKTRDVVLEADSPEDSLARAQEQDMWSDKELDSFVESQVLCKERWKRARAVPEKDYQQAVIEVREILAKRRARKEKGRTK